MRLIHTTPFQKVKDQYLAEQSAAYQIGQAHSFLFKSAGIATTTHALSGELYASSSGWLLLSVPNALVRGVFDALNETGAELPPNPNGKLNAHISVMDAEEVNKIGGIGKISERGHHFHYTLGPIKEAIPDSWDGISKVWFIEIKSKELQDLRKSYGLSALPNDDKYQFHITFAIRRKHILRNNALRKSADIVKPRHAVILRNKLPVTPYPKEQEQFYSSISDHLKNRGFDVSIDDDAKISDADLLVGHSAAAEQLKDIAAHKLFHTEPYEHEKSRIYNTTQRELAKTLGFKHISDLPASLRTAPPVEHFMFTDQMRKALDDKIGYKDPSIVKAPSTAISINKDNNGANYSWVEPATLGAGLAGLGTAALLAMKEGEHHGMLELSEDESRHSETEGDIEESRQDEAEVGGSEVSELSEDEEDFDCSDETSAGICAYYRVEPEREKTSTLGNHKFEKEDLYEVPEDLARKGYGKAKDSVKKTYAKLEKRYGPTTAKLIIGAGLLGAPIPGPGSSFVTAAPFLAAGEIMHAYKGDYVPPKKKKDEEDSVQKRKDLLKLIGSIAAPTAGVGAAAYALHKPTKTDVPAQVTKFPGENTPWVIRGRVSPNAPASTIEHTGNSYIYAGPKETWRAHGHINDIESLGKVLREKLPPDKKLQLLELAGHGSYTGQWLGDAIGPGGNPDEGYVGDPAKIISPKTVKDVVKEFKSVPWTDDAKYIGYGCHTGLCDPQNKSKPTNDWLQYLSDNTGIKAFGAKGYVSSTSGTGLSSDIHRTARGLFPNEMVEADKNNMQSKNFAWSVYTPNKPRQELLDVDKNMDTKHTYASLPSNRLFGLAYDLGKPSAIAGALAAPLIPDKDIARTTAIAASSMAAPMVLSEMYARYGEAAGRNALGHGSGLRTHLTSQSKALPYLALAGLPLLSYGAANLLGRWSKKDKKDKPDLTNRNIGNILGKQAKYLRK